MLATLCAAILLTDPGRLADIGPAPEVRLTDQRGKPFDLASLRGKVVVVSFVYTTCYGTCPATTQALGRVRKGLAAEGLWGETVEFVSISLDPEKDTPAVLAEYAKLQGAESEHWHFLTGPPEKVRKVLDAWDMWARRTPDGALDHPSRIFLVDPKGRQREIYSLEYLRPPAVLDDVRAVLDDRDRH
jgi:protein SCO1/2